MKTVLTLKMRQKFATIIPKVTCTLYKGTRGGVQDKSDCLASPSEHYIFWNDPCHSLKIQGGFLIFCILVNQIFMPLHLKLDLCADLISKDL